MSEASCSYVFERVLCSRPLTIYDFLGDLITQNLIISQVPLEERETTLEGEEEREAFLCFMRKMLQWEPSKRSSAKELAEDE